jgi:hypothetical protein
MSTVKRENNHTIHQALLPLIGKKPTRERIKQNIIKLII